MEEHTTTKTIKVKVDLTIEISEEAYRTAYGCDGGAAEIRSEVKAAAIDTLNQALFPTDEGILVDIKDNRS